MKLPHFLSVTLLLFFSPSASQASSPVNTEDHPEGFIYMSDLATTGMTTGKELRSLKHQEKILVRAEKRMAKIQKFLLTASQNKAGIFNDPVGKWFWIWVISWGLGLLLFALSNGSIGVFLGVLLFLAFVAGSIALVIWLKKQFG